jgi:hypothetical protein
MTVYHRTDAARAILDEGFRDGCGSYGTAHEYRGVWLSDTPLDVNEGVVGGEVVAVDISEDALADYEWVEDAKPYREWLVPADVVNRFPRRQFSPGDRL